MSSRPRSDCSLIRKFQPVQPSGCNETRVNAPNLAPNVFVKDSLLPGVSHVIRTARYNAHNGYRVPFGPRL
jgi:hypothetical protein